MTPILKSYAWRCVICGKSGRSYHPLTAFYDHYALTHEERTTQWLTI